MLTPGLNPRSFFTCHWYILGFYKVRLTLPSEVNRDNKLAFAALSRIKTNDDSNMTQWHAPKTAFQCLLGDCEWVLSGWLINDTQFSMSGYENRRLVHSANSSRRVAARRFCFAVRTGGLSIAEQCKVTSKVNNVLFVILTPSPSPSLSVSSLTRMYT